MRMRVAVGAFASALVLISGISFASATESSGVVVEDSARGTAINQFSFDSKWRFCACGNGAANGSYAYTYSPGAVASIQFNGTQIKLFSIKEPYGAIADVTIDGKSAGSIDAYRSAARSENIFTSAKLPSGNHVLTVTLTNKRNPSAVATAFTIDQAQILNEVAATTTTVKPTTTTSTTVKPTTTTAKPTTTTTAVAKPTITTVVAPTTSTTLLKPSTKSFMRINAGGEPFFTSDGSYWMGDKYFVGGSVSTTAAAIKNATDSRIFTKDRWGMSAYNIPVPAGTYTVKLYMAETATWLPKRDFTVTAEGKTVLANVNIRNEAGGNNTALIKSFTTNVTDGTLNLGFLDNVDHANISGIELLSDVSVGPVATFQTESGVPSMDGFTFVPQISDDFNGDVVDSDKWKVYEPAVDAGGMIRPENVSLTDGMLNIKGQHKVSGGMKNRAATGYGRWVFRFREDKGVGYGATALLWPTSDTNKNGGEVDFFESPITDRHAVYSISHKDDVEAVGTLKDLDISQWHTMTAERTKGKVIIWVDGNEFWRTENADMVPSGDMFFVLQQNLAGRCDASWVECFTGADSENAIVNFQVDYAHFYKAN